MQNKAIHAEVLEEDSLTKEKVDKIFMQNKALRSL